MKIFSPNRYIKASFPNLYSSARIAIIPIVSWEQELLDSLVGDFGFVPLHIPSTIDSYDRSEWLRYRQKNDLALIEACHNFHTVGKRIIIFSYVSNFHFNPEVFDEIRRGGQVFVINFNWDDRLYFKHSMCGIDFGVDKISCYSDLNLTMAEESIPKYKLLANSATNWLTIALMNAHGSALVQRAKNCMVHQKDFKNNRRLLFYGARYGVRKKFVDYLVRSGLRLDAFGDGWDNGPVAADDLQLLCRQYGATLGISYVGNSHRFTCVKGRDLEVLRNGGCYIGNYNRQMSQIFTSGSNLFYYKSLPEIPDIFIAATKDDKVNFQIKENALSVGELLTWRSMIGSVFFYLENLNDAEVY